MTPSKTPPGPPPENLKWFGKIKGSNPTQTQRYHSHISLPSCLGVPQWCHCLVVVVVVLCHHQLIDFLLLFQATFWRSTCQSTPHGMGALCLHSWCCMAYQQFFQWQMFEDFSCKYYCCRPGASSASSSARARKLGWHEVNVGLLSVSYVVGLLLWFSLHTSNEIWTDCCILSSKDWCWYFHRWECREEGLEYVWAMCHGFLVSFVIICFPHMFSLGQKKPKQTQAWDARISTVVFQGEKNLELQHWMQSSWTRITVAVPLLL